VAAASADDGDKNAVAAVGAVASLATVVAIGSAVRDEEDDTASAATETSAESEPVSEDALAEAANSSTSGDESDIPPVHAPASSVASEPFDEAASAESAATRADAWRDAPAEAVAGEEALAFEHDPHTETVTHVEVESDSGDVTVEVETLRFVEERIEATLETDDADEPPVVPKADASIETGEFEMSELGLTRPPVSIIEAEFEAEDIDVSSADSDADSDEDAAADDEEELSAGPQNSTELVAAPPRDRDD
jgi:hypothetical protein